MRLLLLGGPTFVGRAVMDAVAAAGHEVTMFNRGSRTPSDYPEVERLVGDRDGGLGALAGRTWDAVVDTSGYLPRIVGQSARLLAERSTTTCSSRPSPSTLVRPVDEGAPLAALEDPEARTSRRTTAPSRRPARPRSRRRSPGARSTCAPG